MIIGQAKASLKAARESGLFCFREAIPGRPERIRPTRRLLDAGTIDKKLKLWYVERSFEVPHNPQTPKQERKMRKLLSRIRLVTSEFVRKHIVDHEENIWPNMSSSDLHQLERHTDASIR